MEQSPLKCTSYIQLPAASPTAFLQERVQVGAGGRSFPIVAQVWPSSGEFGDEQKEATELTVLSCDGRGTWGSSSQLPVTGSCKTKDAGR